MCDTTRQPMAVVDLHDRFLWCNKAYEILTGYPLAELLTKTWQEITAPEDVGADLAAVRHVKDGHSETYTMDKRYLNRRGGEVAVTLVVRRYPSAPEPILFFLVEAMAQTLTRTDLLDTLGPLQQRLELLEATRVQPVAGNGAGWGQGDPHAGLKIRYLGWAFGCMVAAVMYMFYCLVSLQLKNQPQAPPVLPGMQAPEAADNGPDAPAAGPGQT